MGAEQNVIPGALPRAAIPSLETDLRVAPEREAYWERLIEEARRDPEWAEAMAGEPGRVECELEKNPEWTRFGFRGRVAELLWERGLKRKAVRFANCFQLGQPGVCSRYPEEHRFFRPNGCEVIFCRECASEARRRLFAEYLEVILLVLRELGGVPPGWVLARVNFTLRSDGSEITPERVKKFNRCVRRVMRKSVGSACGFGMLFIDETGFELRGHTQERKAGGLNPHGHGIYFGPRLHWERTRDLWKAETEKVFGMPSFGFFIRAVCGLDKDPEQAIRHGLNHMLKYISKPPAVTPERLAALIAAFDGTRRVHSLGLLYGRKLKPEKKYCPCPRCRAMGIPSVVSFEGRWLLNGGCIPRLAPIEELKAEGYEPLYGDFRLQAVLERDAAEARAP